MSTLAAVDVGFTITGIVIFERIEGGALLPKEFHYSESRPFKLHHRHRYAAVNDVNRVGEMAVNLQTVIDHYDIKRMVVEIPGAGSNDFRSGRCMALASGMIATLGAVNEMRVEFYVPEQTREAAIPGYRKLGFRKEALKQEIIRRMGLKYPALLAADLDANGLEACADALSTFEAAKGGAVVAL